MEDDKEAIRAIQEGLARSLKLIHRSRRNRMNEVRIKCEYKGEKRIVHLKRPAIYDALKQKLSELYGSKQPIIEYINKDGLFIREIRNAADLDYVISLPENVSACAEDSAAHSCICFHLTAGTDSPQQRCYERQETVSIRPASHHPELIITAEDSPSMKQDSIDESEPQEEIIANTTSMIVNHFCDSPPPGTVPSLRSSSPLRSASPNVTPLLQNVVHIPCSAYTDPPPGTIPRYSPTSSGHRGTHPVTYSHRDDSGGVFVRENEESSARSNSDTSHYRAITPPHSESGFFPEPSWKGTDPPVGCYNGDGRRTRSFERCSDQLKSNPRTSSFDHSPIPESSEPTVIRSGNSKLSESAAITHKVTKDTNSRRVGKQIPIESKLQTTKVEPLIPLSSAPDRRQAPVVARLPATTSGSLNTERIVEKMLSVPASALACAPVCAPARGRWQRGTCIGRGAFGEVFKCFDVDRGIELAVKQVRRHPNDKMEVKQLMTEMELFKMLPLHENIVQFYGVEEDESILSVFLEYIPGGSVRDQIKDYGAVTEVVTKLYTVQILRGLAFLHGYQIMHRDIKCANILRTVTGNIKLTDFGASKLLQDQTHTQYTLGQEHQRSIAGTIYYMSPELINGQHYGRATDIWSLGCTVVEMLTSNPPWHTYQGYAVLFRIAEHKVPEYVLPENTSKEAKDFLGLCFTMAPRDRPTAEQLLKNPFIC